MTDIQVTKMKATDSKQNIQVFVRVRPMSAQERIKNPHNILDCPGNREVVVRERQISTSKTFTFDKVFSPKSTQIDVYKSVVCPLLEETLLGYNCTVFAYGQTGTGKTFTMEGERTPDATMSWENDPLAGIVPRALSQLFDDLRLQNAEFTVRVSLLELYNEELFDLLASSNEESKEPKNKTLRIFEDAQRKGSVIIQGLEEVTVHNKNEVYKIMEQGAIRRHTATTQMNAKSSRSHTIFTITVHIKESNVEGEELVKIGKLNLVDLAGSENIGRSGAINKHAREAGSINQSLLTLGRVITALVDRTPHIPYRESKLTRLLQDSLGGRTKTSIIATVSPAFVNLEETLSTLDYAHRAKDITNRPEVNQKMTKKAVLKEYTEEIERLRRDLHATQEKNGVFIDKDNYAQLVARLEAQDEEINSKIQHTRSLEETILKKDEEIGGLTAQLADVEEDLLACNAVLAQTKTQLDQTREELETVISDRDQKTELVWHHVKTEKKLTAQASTLLATTDDVTTNLENLYRKLDRKKLVESKNMEAGTRFKEEVAEGLALVSESVEKFRIEHGEFCGKQRLNLESFLVEKNQKLSGIKNIITELMDAVSNREAKDKVKSHVLTAKTWNKENAKFAEDITQTNQMTMSMLEKKLSSQLGKLEEEVKKFETCIEKVLQQYEKETTEQAQNIQDFVDSRMALITECQEIILANRKTQDMKAAETRAMITEQQSILNSNAAAFNGMWNQLAAFKSEYDAFQARMITSTTNVQAGNDELMLCSTNIIESINACEASAVANTKELVSTAQEKLQRVANNILACENEVKKSLGKFSSEVRSVGEQVGNHRSSVSKAFDDIGNRVLEICKERDVALDCFEANYTNSEVERDNLLAIKVKDLEGGVVDSNQADVETVENIRSTLSNHCSSVSDWSEQAGADARKYSGQVIEFWDTTYLVDGPTGATPQRKSYDYPRLLSATSPHERIIRRYMEGKRENGDSDGTKDSSSDSNEIF